jgi:hypothetical protein
MLVGFLCVSVLLLLLWILNCWWKDDSYMGYLCPDGRHSGNVAEGSWLRTGRASRKGTEHGHGERDALRHALTSSVSCMALAKIVNTKDMGYYHLFQWSYGLVSVRSLFPYNSKRNHNDDKNHHNH